MNRHQAQAAAAGLARMAPGDAFRIGIQLVKADFPELLVEPASALARNHPADARLAQLEGLAARGAGDGPLAHRAFRRAAQLAPRDPLIAHSHARAALDAGRPATGLFEQARRLAPQDGAVLQGLAAALVAERRSDEAIALFTQILQQNPAWLDGHRTLAQILGQYGGDAASEIERAIAAAPSNAALHRLRITTLMQARRLPHAALAAQKAQQALGSAPWLTLLRGHIASELGELAAADALFAGSARSASASEAALLVRHALKAGRADQAAQLIDAWLDHDGDRTLWPYASLAWRLTGDPRAEWLDGWGSAIGVYDLAQSIDSLPDLIGEMRGLHNAMQAPLDQSVRGGTQTDGNLLLRDTPAVQSLRGIIAQTVERHIAALPAPREGHPTLLAQRHPRRIAGSWSVRLAQAGFHTDHVHSQGWLSSALYLSLPDSMMAQEARDRHEGWLSLGEARDVVPGLDPLRLVEPKPGRLVLFPSVMWHGTRPFLAGERLTIAFDIAPPRQD